MLFAISIAVKNREVHFIRYPFDSQLVSDVDSDRIARGRDRAILVFYLLIYLLVGYLL